MTAKEAIACIERELRDGDGLWFGGDEAKAALSVLTAMAEENERLRPILDERKRQDEKWGVQNHSPMTWLAILTEEVGEVAKAVLEGNAGDYRKELTQVAAVSVAMVECFKRGEAVLVSVTDIQKDNAQLKRDLLDAYAAATEKNKEIAALKAEVERLTPEPGNEHEDDEVALFGIETAARHNTANPEILDESFAYVRSRMAVARKAEAELSSLRIEADEHRAELKLIANAIGEFYQGRGNVNTILDRIHSVVWVSAMEDKAREKGEKE